MGLSWARWGTPGSLLPPRLSVPGCDGRRTGLEDASPGTATWGRAGRGSGLASARAQEASSLPPSPLSESRASSSRSRGMESFQRETGSGQGAARGPDLPRRRLTPCRPLCTSLLGGVCGPSPGGKAPARAQCGLPVRPALSTSGRPLPGGGGSGGAGTPGSLDTHRVEAEPPSPLPRAHSPPGSSWASCPPGRSSVVTEEAGQRPAGS